MKNKIFACDYNMYLSEYDEISLEDFNKKVNEIFENAKTLWAQNDYVLTNFTITYIQGDSWESGGIVVKVYRDETDKEYEKRISQKKAGKAAYKLREKEKIKKI